MNQLNDYLTAYSQESFGSPFNFGIRIDVDTPNGVTESVKRLCYKVAAELEQAITRDFYANNAEAHKEAEQERTSLLSLFGNAPIYVEPIPNGYCHQACCEHRPWFVVTTKIGRIKIGWRKRVINIDWSETLAPKAEELFAAETSTKGDKMIHAWGYEKAKEYIATITEST